MGLAGARNSAVTGLQAQSTNISITADNIANAATPGYKAIKGQFSTLVTNTGSSGAGYSSGGVSVSAQTLVESQGLIESTGRVTDVAISGAGFFAVQDDSANLLLTRAASFDINNAGELENAGGFKLLGWPLDDNGRRPGESGNANTTAAESASSLEVIDTNTASGAASPTSAISVGMNLNAGQATFQGATATLNPASTANNAIAQGDIVVPASGMEEGDQISFMSNAVTSTFEYGGFAKSANLADAAVFGASSAATTFSTGSTLADDDQFTITTIASGTATFTFTQNAPDTSQGQFNNLETLATAINNTNGLTARVSGTILYVSSVVATEAITFGDVLSSNLHNELGFSDEAAAASGVNRWNTISGLNTLVNATSQLGAVINNASSGAELEIYASDPLLTMTVAKPHGQVDIDLSSDENGTATDTDVIAPVGDMTIGTSTVSFSDGTNSGTFTYGGIADGNDITASAMYGASLPSTAFTGLATGVDTLTIEADTDDADGAGGTVVTFTYVASPDTSANEFNSLDTLATAINNNANFRARVVNNKIYVSAVDADNGVRINDGVGGNAFHTTIFNTTDVLTSGGTTRFASLTELDAMIEGITNFDTTLTTGANASIEISTTGGESITVGGASNTDLLAELGLASGDAGDGFFAEMTLTTTVAAAASSAVIPVTYDPSDDTKNMAGGNITPHFPRNIQVYDSLGTAHDFNLAFLKVGANEWAVEFYAANPSEISGGGDDGLVASGTIIFNGDGTLQSISSGLTNAINISWTTGASSSTITFDLGTAGAIAGTVGATSIGLTDGIRQFDASYNVEFIEQNGVAAGQFKGVSVSDDGTVFANFSNGEIRAIYQLPILVVANQNALQSLTGNVFAATQESGDVNLKVAGQGGAGVVVPESLEGSTSDIAEELTKTIGIQSNYNANATLISTVRDMEEELNRRL